MDPKRFYVHRVEYNKTKKAENRVVNAYDTEDAAIAAYHEAMRDDINNESISWANVIVTNAYGVNIKNEYWEDKTPVPSI